MVNERLLRSIAACGCTAFLIWGGGASANTKADFTGELKASNDAVSAEITKPNAMQSQKSLGTACNCEKYRGKTGYVDQVLLGVDDATSYNISFKMMFGPTMSDEISVKQTLNDASGRGMYRLLMTALARQIPFTIDRCYSDQVAGAHIGAG